MMNCETTKHKTENSCQCQRPLLVKSIKEFMAVHVPSIILVIPSSLLQTLPGVTFYPTLHPLPERGRTCKKILLTFLCRAIFLCHSVCLPFITEYAQKVFFPKQKSSSVPKSNSIFLQGHPGQITASFQK